MRAAVFLDRDGVIVESRSIDGMIQPILTPDDMVIPEDTPAALHALRGAGYLLVVVTNQPDVARGTLRAAALERVHRQLRARLPLDAVYCCPHDTTDGCDCRKPRPGMLLRATEDLEIDLAMSWLVGDRWVDVAAGHAAGVRSVLLEDVNSWQPTSEGPPPDGVNPTFVAATMEEAARLILGARDAR